MRQLMFTRKHRLRRTQFETRQIIDLVDVGPWGEQTEPRPGGGGRFNGRLEEPRLTPRHVAEEQRVVSCGGQRVVPAVGRRPEDDLGALRQCCLQLLHEGVWQVGGVGAEEDDSGRARRKGCKGGRLEPRSEVACNLLRQPPAVGCRGFKVLALPRDAEVALEAAPSPREHVAEHRLGQLRCLQRRERRNEPRFGQARHRRFRHDNQMDAHNISESFSRAIT